VLKGSGRRKYRFTIRDLLADKRCSQVVFDFLSATDVGRLVPAEEDAGSEASECELRERNEERRAEAEEVGAAGGIFFLVYSSLACDLSDHGEIMYSPFPVRCPRSGGSLQTPLCPPPRPVPRSNAHKGNYKGK